MKETQQHIRSYVRRESHFTPSQKVAFAELWPTYGIDFGDKLLDLADIFGNNAAIICEIGFGNGANLLAACEREPHKNFLGIDVHRPGAGKLIRHAADRNINNLKVMTEDAVFILQRQIPPQSLAALWLFFPDPWHKKRHNKRRILQTEFADLVASRLRPDGEFQMATDWAEYAEHMLAVMDANPAYENCAGTGQFLPPQDNRIQTHFEQRGLKRGHDIFDLLYRRSS